MHDAMKLNRNNDNEGMAAGPTERARPARRRASRARRAGALAAAGLTVTGLVSLASAQPAHAAAPTCTTNGWFDSYGPHRVSVPKDPVGNPRCVMGQGNRGPAVGTLQQTLVRCYGVNLNVDNIFGPRTRDALRYVQARYDGLARDGVYGPQTARRIRHTTYRAGNLCYLARIT